MLNCVILYNYTYLSKCPQVFNSGISSAANASYILVSVNYWGQVKCLCPLVGIIVCLNGYLIQYIDQQTIYCMLEWISYSIHWSTNNINYWLENVM